MKKWISLAIINCLLTTGCVVYPKVAEDQYHRCKLETRRLTLDMEVWESSGKNSSIVVDMIFGAITTAVTTIVSGSIMIAGNTVHWIEQEGTCDDGMLRKSVLKLVVQLEKQGNKVIKLVEDAIPE